MMNLTRLDANDTSTKFINHLAENAGKGRVRDIINAFKVFKGDLVAAKSNDRVYIALFGDTSCVVVSPAKPAQGDNVKILPVPSDTIAEILIDAQDAGELPEELFDSLDLDASGRRDTFKDISAALLFYFTEHQREWEQVAR